MKSIRIQLTAILAVFAVVQASHGAPGDVMTMPAPILGADPPAATSLRDGDASVSTQTGALQYSYPIEVPPGRMGVQPNLALSYSSQSSVYGGVAAGWSLSVPMIERDTADGILYPVTFDPEDRPQKKFISTLAGSRPLVEVTEPMGAGAAKAFRAQNDTSYTRYEWMAQGSAFRWRALGSDGTTYYFGDSHLVAGFIDDDHVPLTRVVDQYDNTVEYAWVRSGLGLYLDEVRYTTNPTAGLEAFAKVKLTWSAPTSCANAPVNGQRSWRTGNLTETGARRLDAITVVTLDHPPHTRQITLGYDSKTETCNQPHAPFRQLMSIQESAWSATAPRVDLPAVRFTYGSANRAEWIQASHGAWTGGSAIQRGRRPGSYWPMVDQMLVDVDGDGLVDRLNARGAGSSCFAEWHRNLGANGEGFVWMGSIQLPTLPWPAEPDPGRGCGLNAQLTFVENTVGTCGPEASNGTYLAYRWMDITGDGLTDLVTAIHYDANRVDPTLFTNFGPWPTCTDDPAGPVLDGDCMDRALESCDGKSACFLSGAEKAECLDPAPMEPIFKSMVCDGAPSDPVACESAGPGGFGCELAQIPFELCGQYPWIIYKNLGNGVFAEPEIKLNPIPLESHNGDSPSGPGAFSSSAHALIDLDGDGLQDAVSIARLDDDPTTPGPETRPRWWYVWKGDGTGGFRRAENGFPYFWFVPEGAVPSMQTGLFEGPEPDDAASSSTQGMADLNGDGLQDFYWQRSDVGPVEVYWNRGNQFDMTPTELAVDTVSGTYVVITDGNHQRVNTGTSWRKTQLLDYDDDGRSDLQLAPTYGPQDCVNASPRLRFGDGEDFIDGYTLNPQECIATNVVNTAQPHELWETREDFVDIDGDGVAERIQAVGGQLMRTQNEVDGKPARLLTKVENGQGLTIEIDYGSLADSTLVTSDAATRKASPKTKWVVRSLRTTDAYESTPQVATYKYIHPVWSPDDRGDWDFRGFRRVRTSNRAVGGGVTEERYEYSPDWSGRLSRTLTFPAELGGTSPTSITETNWQRYTLFDGDVETFHPRLSRTYICANGQDEANCLMTPVAMSREETVWTALASTTGGGSTPLLYAATGTYLQDGEWFDEGDRSTETSYALRADASTYRLRSTVTESKVLEGTSHNTYAKSETVWDATHRFALEERVWSSSDVVAATRRTYHSTGHVVTIQKPSQVASGGPTTELKHDPTRRFVVKESNELGHLVESTFDSGTGVELRRIGPNKHSCHATSTCGANLGREEHRTEVDGLGRPIKTWVTRDASPGYVLVQVGATSYVDTGPVSVTSKRLIDFGGTRWTEEKTTLDGHGRPIQSITYGGLAPAQTTYDYDDLGKLASVTLPDPSNPSSTPAYVTYTYTFDTIGRPTGIRRPDGSGIDLAYDGVVHSRREIAGAAGGPEAVTELHHDGFGRLVTVNELLDGGSFATTIYGYDARDAVSFIEDPDGVTTAMQHDWMGRRLQIARENRVWSYKYDLNGNLESETSPGSNPLEHTTTYAYDHLDRVTSRLVAGRGLDQATKNELGIGEVVYVYDETLDGGNRTGRMFRVETRALGAAVPVLVRQYLYDAEGNVREDRIRYRFGGIDHTRRVQTTYGPGGKVASVDYGDGAGTNNIGTTSTTTFDDRSLPSLVNLVNAGSSTSVSFARNIAGQVTSRNTAGTPGQESRWTYDPLGRVLSQEVKLTNGSVIASQKLTYFGSDDPKTLVHFAAGLATRSFTFAYDRRHQLTATTTSQGTFGSAYTFQPSGRLATATVSASAASGSDVVPRSVEYVYQASDPEMVSELRNANGSAFATYAYDASGNITNRTQQGVATTFLWDGDDQLRRATSSAGSEDYYYDHTGTRVALVKRTASGSITQRKLFLGPLEVWLSSTGALTNRFAHITQGTPLARVETNLVGTTVELQYHSTLQSLLATVRRNATSADTTFMYGPYGEVVQAAGPQLASHRRRYNDKHKDELTSWSYYGYRYYDPTLQTWTSADPMYRFAPDAAWDEPRRANLYTFNDGNPLRHVDPDGRQAVPVRPPPPTNPPPIDISPVQVPEATPGAPTHRNGPTVTDHHRQATEGPQMPLAADRSESTGKDGVAVPSMRSSPPRRTIGTLVTALAKKIARREATAGGGGGGKDGEAKATEPSLRRPYLRKATRAEVESRAPRDESGRPIDPNTGRPIEGKPDTGHKTGREFRRERAKAESEGLSQREFNDRMNDPNIYQLECPISNRSHRYEQKP